MPRTRKMSRMNRTTNFCQDARGASAVEFAIIAPVFLTMFFGIIHLGLYFFGVHQAQQATEVTAREVRLINRPSEAEIQQILADNTRDAFAGTYTPSVQVLSEFGEDFAEIEIQYSYRLPIPFIDRIEFSTNARSKALLRDIAPPPAPAV